MLLLSNRSTILIGYIITLTPNGIIIRIGGVGIHLVRTVTIPHAGIGYRIPISAIFTPVVGIVVAIVIRSRIVIGGGIITAGGLGPSGIVVGVGFGIAVGSAEETGGGGGGVALIFAPVGGLCAGIGVGPARGGVVGVVS